MVLFNERTTTPCAILAKSFGWPFAGVLLRQSAERQSRCLLRAFPDESSRERATTAHAISGF